jgi:hypothetical protein
MKREIMEKFEKVAELEDCTFNPVVNNSRSPKRDL